MDEVRGKVTIAPSVLTTIVRLTTLEQPGVNRLAPMPPKVRGLFAGRAAEEGIFVEVTDAGVQVEVHLIADAAVNLLKLGEGVQAQVRRALEEMVGLPVAWVDVYIDGVTMPIQKAGE